MNKESSWACPEESQEQLEADHEEIMAMNEKLESSVQEINELNERFVNMINLVSSLDQNETDKSFLSDLLETAIDIVPEADYGKICILDQDTEVFKFINAIGHDFQLLKDIRVSKEIFFEDNKPDIYTSKKYFINIKNLPPFQRYIFEKALKPISKSIHVNIRVHSDIVGKISLDIANSKDGVFSDVSKQILKSFASLASAVFSFQRYNKLQDQFTRELITSIVQIMEMYDQYTSSHSENVAKMASEIAGQMGLSQNKINDAYWSGMVHDIGKLLIPIDILNKNGPLTDEEYEKIKKHPIWGKEALKSSKTLKHIADYVLYHHERWDGKGYPKGLKEDEIPIVSQILCVVDSWDAMTSRRAYRNALPKSKAIEELIRNKGKQFSPEVVDTFLKQYNLEFVNL